MPRRCLDCPALIASGSRCADCRRSRRQARHPRCTIEGCTTPTKGVALASALVYTMQSIEPERRQVLLCARCRAASAGGGRGKLPK